MQDKELYIEWLGRASHPKTTPPRRFGAVNGVSGLSCRGCYLSNSILPTMCRGTSPELLFGVVVTTT
jgi:hypothetical protein